MNVKETQSCSECESLYYKDRSAMAALCPECAYLLYGYKICEHQFENGRCLKCFWDGSRSDYIKKLLIKDEVEDKSN